MMKLTFLKLEGLRGPSFAPRHLGDFEFGPYYTFSRQPIRRVGPSDRTDADFNHVLLQKSSDESTMPLNRCQNSYVRSRCSIDVVGMFERQYSEFPADLSRRIRSTTSGSAISADGTFSMNDLTASSGSPVRRAARTITSSTEAEPRSRASQSG